MKPLALSDDGHCFACGEKNPIGLGLVFREEGGRMTASFTPLKMHQGFKDMVHGGIITTVLDEAMIKAVLARDIEAVTAAITVRFKHPLRVGTGCRVEAGVKRLANRLIEAEASLTDADGVVVAEAEGKLLRNG